MSDALGNAKPARGLAGALQRHARRAAEHVVFPRQRDDDQTPPEIEEPTGECAVVVDADQIPYVRLSHRWYKAGDPTRIPILWPEIQAVVVLSRGRR